MRKSQIILFILILVVILSFVIVNAFKTEPKQKIPTSTWTKAVCNEKNYCSDVEISCDEGKIVSIKPTGEGINLPENWIDPRPVEIIEKWC